MHAGFLVVGLALLLALALPVATWEGINPADSGALWFTVPSALIVGTVGGGVEGLLLRVSQPLGWTAAGIACLFGFYVPGAFAHILPEVGLPGSSAALAAAWVGWLMFMLVLTGAALGVLAVRSANHQETPTPPAANRQ